MLPIQMDRNSKDQGTITIGNKRPDFLCWTNNVLLFKGKEKAEIEDFSKAKDELEEKFNKFDPMYFGNIQFMICYAAAGTNLRFYAIDGSPNTNPPSRYTDFEHFRINRTFQTYDVSVETLRRWADSGRIAIVRTPGGKRLYSITDIQEIFRDNQQTQITQKAKICYVRVSSEHQRDDLERQIANLRQYYPEYEIISDIGSGLNWKHRGFVALLERIHTEGIEEVVVTRKDRLCRFGSELVEWIFEKNGTRLVVLGTDVSAESSEAGELAEDLLSIVTVFVARHNGMRSAANRRRRREVAKAQEEQELQDSSRQDTMYPSLSYARGEVETQTLDGNSAIDLQSISRSS
ncbi:hypothetical protein Glove_123g105 [Diversispora epigaea]|uniref:Resolvase/invertase-type recombinase catalytic domain-containing protein n=1 Tax=Diversispora epigaea TaxID=1348612 RepID=A0A397J153_9GLOM|nr:hypothetical protein Glove_123g105 [Diversispora epigaea]